MQLFKNHFLRYLVLIIALLSMYRFNADGWMQVNNIQHILSNRMNMLSFCQEHLRFIPGIEEIFNSLIANIDRIQAKGFWFELEAAVFITKKNMIGINQERVVGFHCWLTKPTAGLRREIDIVTTKRCIECKNINWHNLTVEQEDDILTKLQTQKALVKWYNTNKTPIHSHYNLKYVLWSRNSISDRAKALLATKRIKYIEGIDDSIIIGKMK